MTMRLVGFSLFLLLVACKSPATESKPAEKPEPAVTPAGIEVVKAKPGDEPLETLVTRELARAKADSRRLLVYVGATWCEPCRRFKAAAKDGSLKDAFTDLRLLEFDKDTDNDRLEAAGYTSKYIPLFALPGPDGRHSGRHIEGSIKGPGAIGNIVPRLKKLLAY